MEIERKYLIDKNNIPCRLEDYPSRQIEQGYLCTNPVVRIRKDNDRYELTYKSRGMMIREEHNLPLTAEGYEHLKTKIDGICIEKTRYMIPLSDSLTIELDIFSGKLSGLQIAEVEFADAMSAEHFTPPDWFGEDVTFCPQYHNSALSQMKLL